MAYGFIKRRKSQGLWESQGFRPYDLGYSVIMMRAAFFFIFFISQLTGSPKIIKEEFVFIDAPFPSCHASTIVELPSGKLLCSWFGGTEESASDVAIWLSSCEKDIWSPPREVAREEAPCWNPVLFQLPSQEILLFYKAGPSPRGWTGFLKRSLDQGLHWSSSEKLPAGILGPIKNKPLLLEDGSLLCGSSIESWQANACWLEITRDGGKTWEKKGPISLKNPHQGIIQPTLFFDCKGALKMLFRPRQGLRNICQTYSLDEGKTWAPVEILKLSNPDSAIDAVKLKNGTVLLVYNDLTQGRNHLDIAISEEGEDHWEHILTLEDSVEGEYSYPAVIQSQDGKVHITYTWNRRRIKHVVVAL